MFYFYFGLITWILADHRFIGICVNVVRRVFMKIVFVTELGMSQSGFFTPLPIQASADTESQSDT